MVLRGYFVKPDCIGVVGRNFKSTQFSEYETAFANVIYFVPTYIVLTVEMQGIFIGLFSVNIANNLWIKLIAKRKCNF